MYNKILIIAITRMGDLLQASPTIQGLKNQYPDSRITIVVDTNFASICKGIPGIDEIKELDMNYIARGVSQGGEGLVGCYDYISKLVSELRNENFDYCLNMSNSAYTAILIKLLDIKACRGWLSDDEGFRLMADSWSMLFSAFVYHSNRDYNGMNLVDIFRCGAEVNKHPLGLQFNPSQEGEIKMRSLLSTLFKDSDGPLIGIQVGASQEKRQWSAKNFALLTKYLVQDLNARIIYTGSRDESELVLAVQNEYSTDRAVNLAGKTNIDELGSLLSLTDLLITGDTGPMHLSVAVGTPVVALFLASALCYETGPYSSGNLIIQPQISCNPCNPNYPCIRPDCHDLISPELVNYLAKLRLRTSLEHDGFIQVAEDIAPSSQVRIFRSAFDTDGFLEFIQINGKTAEKGYPEGYLDSIRQTYRKLWKEELANIKQQSFVPNETKSQNLFPNSENIIELCKRAYKYLDLLKDNATNPIGSLNELQEISKNLNDIELEIEEISLTFPILGAVVRIFIMSKENIRGDNLVKLADDTKKLYEDLERRIINFGRFYFEVATSETLSRREENDTSNSR